MNSQRTANCAWCGQNFPCHRYGPKPRFCPNCQAIEVPCETCGEPVQRHIRLVLEDKPRYCCRTCQNEGYTVESHLKRVIAKEPPNVWAAFDTKKRRNVYLVGTQINDSIYYVPLSRREQLTRPDKRQYILVQFNHGHRFIEADKARAFAEKIYRYVNVAPMPMPLPYRMNRYDTPDRFLPVPITRKMIGLPR